MLARNLKELESRSRSRMFLATPRSHGGRRYIGNFSGTCEVKPKKEREGEVSQSPRGPELILQENGFSGYLPYLVRYLLIQPARGVGT